MNKIAILLTGLGLAGLNLTAHALCLNPDGSLDDPSVSPSTIATDMLPTCQGAKATNAAQAATAQGGSNQTAEHANAKADSKSGQSGAKS